VAAHSDFVMEFVRAGMLDQMKEDPRCPPELFDPLVRFIRAGAPTGLVRLMLDRGADPNSLGMGSDPEGALCPLSAAVLAGSASVFQLLLARGADIHGPQRSHCPEEGHERGEQEKGEEKEIEGKECEKEDGLKEEGQEKHRQAKEEQDEKESLKLTLRTIISVPERPPVRALYIPTFAAAYAMANRLPRARTMMRLCLDAGADINARAPVRGGVRIGRISTAQFYEVTALTTLLDSIESWDDKDFEAGRRLVSPEEDDDDGHGENKDDSKDDPVTNVRFLLERGATVDNTDTSRYWWWTRPQAPDTSSPPPPPRMPTLAIVLDRWNGAGVAQPHCAGCAGVVALLIRHGGMLAGTTPHLVAHFVDPGRYNHIAGATRRQPRPSSRHWQNREAQQHDEAVANARGLVVLTRLLAAGLVGKNKDTNDDKEEEDGDDADHKTESNAAHDELLATLAAFAAHWGAGRRRESDYRRPQHTTDAAQRCGRTAIRGAARALVMACRDAGVRTPYCGPGAAEAGGGGEDEDEAVEGRTEKDYYARRVGGAVCREFHDRARMLRDRSYFPAVNEDHREAATKLLRMLVGEGMAEYKVLANGSGTSEACSCTEYFLMALEDILRDGNNERGFLL
jgi:hypothetical protein